MGPLSNTRSQKIHSFISSRTNSAHITPLSFTVPAGTVFRGTISGTAIGPTTTATNGLYMRTYVQDGGGNIVWQGAKNTGAVASSVSIGATAEAQLELQPGTYLVYVEISFATPSLCYAHAIGTCYYQDRL